MRGGRSTKLQCKRISSSDVSVDGPISAVRHVVERVEELVTQHNRCGGNLWAQC